MKAAFFVSALAVMASAVPVASPDPEASCGPMCVEMKRSAEAIADALSTRQDNWCHLPGQSCGKIKRHADALALAAANAYNTAFAEESNEKRAADGNYKRPPNDNWCHLPGQSCGKAKRNADPEALDEKRAASGTYKQPPPDNWCHLPGQSCGKAKRDADASPEAQPNPEAFDEYVQKLRRAASGTYKPPPPDNWCHLPGQSCGKIRRAYEDLILVTREASEAL